MSSKYKRGLRLMSVDDFLRYEFVIVNGKVYHQGWTCSWPTRLAWNYISRGVAYAAVPAK